MPANVTGLSASFSAMSSIAVTAKQKSTADQKEQTASGKDADTEKKVATEINQSL